jgi:hypothetical protein
MNDEHIPANSLRLVVLAQKMADKAYRDAYVASHTRRFLAKQMREFRGDLSQGEFGRRLGKPQTIVSRLEDPGYSGWSLRTVLETAASLNVAAFVRFVDFPTFLKYTLDMSENAMRPHSYDPSAINEMVADEAAQNEPQGAMRAFLSEGFQQQKLIPANAISSRREADSQFGQPISMNGISLQRGIDNQFDQSPMASAVLGGVSE